VTLVAWLDAPDDRSALLGGKFGSLAELVRAGFAVPPGFGITTEAHRAFVAHGGLEARIDALRTGLATDDLVAVERCSAAIRTAILAAPMPAGVEAGIRESYAELSRRTGEDDVPVAVRSSGTLEDSAAASFAGQYDTFLWVRGADAVLGRVRECWAGLFGPRVLTYAERTEGAAMCVGVQQMVPARAAGVAFTLDPLTGDRSKIVVEAAWGLGEGVVGGDVTPDRFRVDKITFEILAKEIADQEAEHRFDPASGEVRLLPVEAERRRRPCLTDEQLTALASEAKRVERHRGAPQDIEWAIDVDGRLHVLQVRPETVWSRRGPKKVTSTAESGIGRVLASFISPQSR
jgi:pyruvate, water dikinase